MDPTEARRLLGVGPDAGPRTIRTAYRQLLRRRHPDVAGDDDGATQVTADLNAAYACLLEERQRPRGSSTPRTDRPPDAATAAPAPRGPTDPQGPVVDDHGRDVELAAATLDVLDQLCEAADRIGDLSYVDRSSGILETILSPPGGPPCSLLVQLRQRGDETLANCTLESLDRRPGPPIDAVVADLRAELAAVEAERGGPG